MFVVDITGTLNVNCAEVLKPYSQDYFPRHLIYYYYVNFSEYLDIDIIQCRPFYTESNRLKKRTISKNILIQSLDILYDDNITDEDLC